MGDQNQVGSEWRQLYVDCFTCAYNDRSWSALFGISIPVCEFIWTNILPRSAVKERKYLLWALYFLKCYTSSDAAHCLFRVSEKTYRSNVWNVLFALDTYLNAVHFDARQHDPLLGNVNLCVDSKLCPIRIDRSVWEHQKLWYDGYHHKHGIKYQIAVHARTGRIHHFVGGVFGSISDVQLLRGSGLLEGLQPGEAVYADKGYVGEHPIVLCPFKTNQLHYDRQAKLAWNEHINETRVIVENVLCRLCKFACVHNTWRHPLEMHPLMMNVCVQLTDLDILFNPVRRDTYEDPYHVWTD